MKDFTEQLVPWHISISELNGAGGGELKNTLYVRVIQFVYLCVCRLSPIMVALLFYKIAASCELSPGCGAEVSGGVHSL